MCIRDSSGKDLTYFDDESRERYLPYIVETSAGVDRTLLTCLVDAYEEEELEKDTRIVLHLDPKLAPIKAAILPLVNRDGMPDIAMAIYHDTKKYMNTFYDQGGSIGRRYRRQDEAGTPFGITVDSQTLEDGTVTVRDRDTLEQIRISKDMVLNFLKDKLAQ